ncbi:MAG: hypothetical protein L6V83_07240 [Christensenella sp.]|nr:MAG: hypothetical protein L6V83_07240 [Christensenella sp.]
MIENLKLGPFDGYSALIVIIVFVFALVALVAVLVVSIIKAIKERKDAKEDKAENDFLFRVRSQCRRNATQSETCSFAR